MRLIDKGYLKMSSKIQELISPSGKFKAVIHENQDSFSIDLFILSDNSETGSSDKWLRKNITSILCDKIYYPRAVAINELRKIMSDPDTPLSIEWVRDFSFCENARFVSPDSIDVYSTWGDSCKEEDSIKVKTIIDFSGLCIIEEVGYENVWQMGEINDKGAIHCFNEYGNIKDALKSL